jgi:tRNA-2-methylthio-N6-dimethylallyladenosine synthase
MGCMAQRLGDELLAELPHLDFVLGTGQLHQLVDTVEKITKERCRLSRTEESIDVLTNLDGHYNTDCCAEIAITRGCNRFCSYCIVPYVRGREISREQEDIIKEAKELAARGVKEILLLGQNVAAYGLGGDIRPPKDGYSPFADLLEELNKIEGIKRIRFTSPYISYFNDRLIEAIANSSKVCNNLHLPVQSGSNTILKAMNRQYTRESYLEKVAQLKAAIPNLTLSTDVIV